MNSINDTPVMTMMMVNNNNKQDKSSDLDQPASESVSLESKHSKSNKSNNKFSNVPNLNPIPSAYSWRVVPAANYYSQPTTANTYQPQQWQAHQNDPVYNHHQYVQQSANTAAIYSIDSNSDLQYDYTAYQNINYNYTPAYNYSPHNNLAYSYDTNSQTSTSPSSTANNQQFHHLNYDDYYNKDKVSGIGANLAYHYIPNDHVIYNNHLNNITNNNSNNNNTIAQQTTDNNNNNYYPNQQYRKSNRYTNSVKPIKTDFNNVKNKQDSKKLNNKSVNNNNSNKVSVSVDENLNKKNSETIKSVSPLVNQEQNNSQAYYDYSHNNNNNNNINNYSTGFYNTPYNQSHFNQHHYLKSVNYKQEFYGQPQYHDPNLDSSNLEVNMANLNLVTYFPHNTLDKNNNDLYDPKEFFINGERENVKKSRFFVIKSYSKDDVIHSIKNGIWCSTEEGNKKLDKAFNECVHDTNASVYLFFSVNSSGHFCGIAEMMTRLDYESKSELWTQDKWKGTFEVKWIYVKDVPNIKLRHILLANNENKPVTNSRDTQEVFYDDALLVLDVFRTHIKKNSILDEYDSEMVFNQFNETNRYSLDRKNKFF